MDTDEYENIDEITAPPPVENLQKGDKALQTWSEDRTEASAQPEVPPSINLYHTSSTSSQAHGVSEEYANLDELAAPSPVENPEEERVYQRHDLEENRREDQEDALNHSRRSTQPNQKSEETSQWTYIREPKSISAEQDTSRREQEDVEKSDDTPSSSDGKLQQQQHAPSKIMNHLYVTSYLIFFSILATLVRLGLQALTIYPGAPVAISELWANVGGCFMMGYLSEECALFRREWEASIEAARQTPEYSPNSNNVSIKDKALISAAKTVHKKAKKTIPAYIGLAVGFCGSFTSFSSFMRDTFLALSDNINICPFTNDATGSCIQGSRNAGNSVMAVLAVLLIEICLCLSALMFGAHTAIALDPVVSKIPALKTRKVLDPVMVVLAAGAWIGAVIMTIWPPDRVFGGQESWRGKAIFAIVFAPLGCLARFHASLRLNGLWSKFPVGTFVVNILGTMLLGLCWDLQRAYLGSGLVDGGLVGCQTLQGIQDGFCGCLTTVSTWVVELQGLRRKHAYFYGMMSVGIGLSSLVIIMGSLVWKQGILQPVCTS